VQGNDQACETPDATDACCSRRVSCQLALASSSASWRGAPRAGSALRAPPPAPAVRRCARVLDTNRTQHTLTTSMPRQNTHTHITLAQKPPAGGHTHVAGCERYKTGRSGTPGVTSSWLHHRWRALPHTHTQEAHQRPHAEVSVCAQNGSSCRRAASPAPTQRARSVVESPSYGLEQQHALFMRWVCHKPHARAHAPAATAPARHLSATPRTSHASRSRAHAHTHTHTHTELKPPGYITPTGVCVPPLLLQQRCCWACWPCAAPRSPMTWRCVCVCVRDMLRHALPLPAHASAPL
jgi:hypothetical protein